MPLKIRYIVQNSLKQVPILNRTSFGMKRICFGLGRMSVYQIVPMPAFSFQELSSYTACINKTTHTHTYTFTYVIVFRKND